MTGKANPKLDSFFENSKKWKQEFLKLRGILLKTELTEELKWYQPCYTFEGKNLMIIGGFKDNCVLSFFNGASMRDSQNLLQKPGDHSRFTRVMRFKNIQEIIDNEEYIKQYIAESIALEKSGIRPKPEKEILEMPLELKEMFSQDAEYQAAFEKLSPGKQRYYLIYFSDAKLSATRQTRIEKYRPKILDGKGFNER